MEVLSKKHKLHLGFSVSNKYWRFLLLCLPTGVYHSGSVLEHIVSAFIGPSSV